MGCGGIVGVCLFVFTWMQKMAERFSNDEVLAGVVNAACMTY